ncbi:hypothetical protein BDD12DRAFT_333306 [Trichophaea hybrida]|nr:hypothetical protein BDD12DRAFT_333306 [Trichophaea hybrida]
MKEKAFCNEDIPHTLYRLPSLPPQGVPPCNQESCLAGYPPWKVAILVKGISFWSSGDLGRWGRTYTTSPIVMYNNRSPNNLLILRSSPKCPPNLKHAMYRLEPTHRSTLLQVSLSQPPTLLIRPVRPRQMIKRCLFTRRSYAHSQRINFKAKKS